MYIPASKYAQPCFFNGQFFAHRTYVENDLKEICLDGKVFKNCKKEKGELILHDEVTIRDDGFQVQCDNGHLKLLNCKFILFKHVRLYVHLSHFDSCKHYAFQSLGAT